jgi:hypothetical protein
MTTAATGPDGTYTITNVQYGRSVEILNIIVSGYAPQINSIPKVVWMVMSDIEGIDFTMEPEKPSSIPWTIIAIAAAAALAALLFLIWHRRFVEVIKVHSDDVTIQGSDRARRKREYAFKVFGPSESGTIRYRVGDEGEWKPLVQDEEGWYVLPAEDVVDRIILEWK